MPFGSRGWCANMLEVVLALLTTTLSTADFTNLRISFFTKMPLLQIIFNYLYPKIKIKTY